MTTDIRTGILDLAIVGAGPGGIALAAEAQASGLLERVVVLEKTKQHNGTVRKFYPEQKLTTVNYKGLPTAREGLLGIRDMTKPETLSYFDDVIGGYGLDIRYGVEVFRARRMESSEGGYFHIETSRGEYDARQLAIAIGILGRPNKPDGYALPGTLKQRLLFDLTSVTIENEDVLVVGGGDSAVEYVEELQKRGNRVTLSYRQDEFTRLNRRNYDVVTSLEEGGLITILRGSNIERVEDRAHLPYVVFKEATHASRAFDRVVYALGGTAPAQFLRTLGVPLANGRAVIDRHGETLIPGLFLLGDLASGPKGGSILTAFNSAARTMRRIRQRLEEYTHTTLPPLHVALTAQMDSVRTPDTPGLIQ